ncbi:hypothetical protein [Nocardia sp. CNY236]|uniref:hypothetical protein n=1 Tax=Nocardia sp. CNY236 TaxID=1169152 RepID=UPI0003F732D4|nr:hypothetical protein [Nocardia sp. CNY236]
MLPSFTPDDCIKAARSSAGGNCVRVGRKHGWTALWDDKLATSDTAGDEPLAANQLLIVSHEQFDAFQAALRSGGLQGGGLLVTERSQGERYEFTMVDSDARAVEVTLYFDAGEFAAFIDGIGRHEFDLDRFPVAA